MTRFECVEAVDILNNLDALQQKVIYSDTFLDISKEEQEKIYVYCLAHATCEAVRDNLLQIRSAVTKQYFGLGY